MALAFKFGFTMRDYKIIFAEVEFELERLENSCGSHPILEDPLKEHVFILLTQCWDYKEKNFHQALWKASKHFYRMYQQEIESEYELMDEQDYYSMYYEG